MKNDLKILYEHHKKCMIQFDRLIEVYESSKDVVPLIKLKKNNREIFNVFRIGLLTVSLPNLIRLFGFPHKINLENESRETIVWEFFIGHSVLVIYDHCIGLQYDKKGKDLFDIHQWSIGSNSTTMIDFVKTKIKEYDFVSFKQ